MDESTVDDGPLEVEQVTMENENEPEMEAGIGTQAQMRADPKWNGIPPVGNRPISDKWKFLLLILLVFVVKIIIWGFYRYSTGTLDFFTNPDDGRENTYWVGMVAKPVLQLAPVFFLWWYVFKEKGMPFRFTRKHLFSSIVLGCILGLVFYFVATGVMVGVFNLSGHGTDFHFVAGWDDAGSALIIAMMFSYMIGTGPTEEIFSRGFLQDQAARPFPLWFAILFASGLFAIGHLPISILVYHLPFKVIAWYMIILVIMGCYFGILYQWSRNIVFPAIIHGLWDWYLSLFALRGAYSNWFMGDPDANFGMFDFISTLISLAIMLPIYYIVYLVWWKHDKPLEDGPLAGIVVRINRIDLTNRIRELDKGSWPKRYPLVVTAVIVGIFCLAMYPVAAAIGTDNPDFFNDRIIGQEEGELRTIYDNKTISEQGVLNEGQSEENAIFFDEKEVISIELSLTWQDEADAGPNYNNLPDTFKLELYDLDGDKLGSDEGDSGSLAISWQGVEGTKYSGNFTAVVTLVSAGNQVPLINLFGPREITDDSNAYTLDIEYQSFTMGGSDQGSDDVRW